jgi:hypothetical protein
MHATFSPISISCTTDSPRTIPTTGPETATTAIARTSAFAALMLRRSTGKIVRAAR